MKKRWLVLGLGLSLTMSSVTFPMEKNVVLASEVGSESTEEVTQEGFLANLTVEAYGINQVIIKNVSEDVKTKLQKCVWNRKGISAEQTVDFKVKGTDLILKNCRLASGDSLILSNKAEKLKKEFGPFQSNPKDIHALSEGQFLGWDSEEKAIIGLDDTMEYRKYDWYSYDREQWMPVQGGKISVDRYSGDIDKNFEIRYAAKGYTFASGTKHISGMSDIFYQPELFHGGGSLKGMAFRIEDVETSPQAVVDYTLFEGNISDFQYKKVKAGEGSFEEGGYTDFQVPADGKVIKLPIKRGEILGIIKKNTKIVFVVLPFHEGGKLGTKFYHLSSTGKEMYVDTSRSSVFEYKEKGESAWKKVTRNKIQTGYDGSHAKTLTFRSRAWDSDFTEERDITIDPESNYFKYDRHADLKVAPLEIRLIEKKVVIQGLTKNHQAYQYKLVAENDVSDEGFKTLPTPSEEYKNIELPLVFSDIKELENQKLVIKTTYGTKTAIHFKPHTKEKFFGTLRQIPNTTRVEGIWPAFEIRKKGEDVSSAKIAMGMSSEKTPGTYLVRYPEYEDDLGELRILLPDDYRIDNSPFDRRAIQTKFGYERDDLDIYLPGGEFEFVIKPADQVKPEEGNNQGNGNSGSGNTGGGSTGGTTPPSTTPGTDSGNSGSGNAGSGNAGGGSTGGSTTTPGTGSGNTGGGNAGGGSTGGTTITPNVGGGIATTPTNTETKKEEVKKEETKKDDTGKSEVKPEEPKIEETVKPEVEVVKETAKTKILASEENIKNVLESENGKLDFVLKKARVVVNKATVEAIFGENVGKLEVSISAKAPKKNSKDRIAITKALKNERTLVSKEVINIRLKADGKTLKNAKLKNEMIAVSYSIKLQKAPKTVYVMDVKTGKLIKAKYDRKTKTLSFKTNKLGKFVVVKKK